MNRGMVFGLLAVCFFVGCATAPPVLEKRDLPDVAAPAAKPPATSPATVEPPRLFDERDLLLEGVVLLGPPEKADPQKARSIFLSLIRRYPQGRWRPAAEAFLRLIDEREASAEMSRQDRLQADKARAERLKAQQENDQLKRSIRELTEKFQTDSAALAQENEQLKRDIQRLKALEIELQKREKMLR